jgi:hypothetical protein
MEMQPCPRPRDRRSACFGNNPVSQTRKLAAILAADVVGYSRLMGEDEAGTARAVREHREEALGSFCVASAMFLILELSQPYTSSMRVSSDGIDRVGLEASGAAAW